MATKRKTKRPAKKSGFTQMLDLLADKARRAAPTKAAAKRKAKKPATKKPATKSKKAPARKAAARGKR